MYVQSINQSINQSIKHILFAVSKSEVHVE